MLNDPFDVLTGAAAADRRSWDQPVDLDQDPTATAILQRVVAGSVAPRRRRRRRAIIGAGAAVLVAAGSAVAASTWVRRAPTTVRALACWNHADAGSDDLVILGERFGHEDPTETCARRWADPQIQADLGVVVTGPFVTCVADYGTAIVIPGASEEACDDAGLDRFDGRIPEELLAIRDVEDEMVELLLAGTCFGETDGTAAVREALDRHGLDDWTVAVEPNMNDTDDVCATFAYDEATSAATIVWMPRELFGT